MTSLISCAPFRQTLGRFDICLRKTGKPYVQKLEKFVKSFFMINFRDECNETT